MQPSWNNQKITLFPWFTTLSLLMPLTVSIHSLAGSAIAARSLSLSLSLSLWCVCFQPETNKSQYYVFKSSIHSTFSSALHQPLRELSASLVAKFSTLFTSYAQTLSACCLERLSEPNRATNTQLFFFFLYKTLLKLVRGTQEPGDNSFWLWATQFAAGIFILSFVSIKMWIIAVFDMRKC